MTLEPAAITGGIGWEYNFPREDQAGRKLGAFDSINFFLENSWSLTKRQDSIYVLALRFDINGTGKSTVDGVRVVNSETIVATFSVGARLSVDLEYYFAPAIGFGLTEEAPDVFVSFTIGTR